MAAITLTTAIITLAATAITMVAGAAIVICIIMAGRGYNNGSNGSGS